MAKTTRNSYSSRLAAAKKHFGNDEEGVIDAEIVSDDFDPDAKHSRGLRSNWSNASSSTTKKASFGPRPADIKGVARLAETMRNRRAEQLAEKKEARKLPPKGRPAKAWLSEPGKLSWASKRGMVKQIAAKANPKSKDSSDVFTLSGKRYALTDTYKAPITEKIGDIGSMAKAKSHDWWDRNKKKIVIGAISATAGWLLYTSWKNTQLRNRLAASRHGGSGGPRGHHAGAAGWALPYASPYGFDDPYYFYEPYDYSSWWY